MSEFVVGTGGGDLNSLVSAQPNLVTSGVAFGVLKLTLSSTSYTWDFLPVAGASYRDSGFGSCH